MFNFIQKPSRAGGTIAVLDDGENFQQVAFHTGSDNFGETFLRISAGILTQAAGVTVERFTMQYESSWHKTPCYDDVVVENQAAQVAWDSRQAA